MEKWALEAVAGAGGRAHKWSRVDPPLAAGKAWTNLEDAVLNQQPTLVLTSLQAKELISTKTHAGTKGSYT